ncbi:MAG: DUF1638 domain-containing protein, partial [Candidatus Electrothrix sp. AR4]|nr:DUF1638 domain-containing protein [Candidatus Electrothrix sp. AR4]
MALTFCFIVCKNLFPEMKAAVQSYGLKGVDIRSFPVRCGSPAIKWQELAASIEESDADIVEIFGSCCLRELTDPPPKFSGCRINQQEQCLYLLCSPTTVDALQMKGAFLLSPGWLRRWKKYITNWGFDQPTAIEFFGESLQQLMLLDTGTEKNSQKHLADFGDFLQLPTDTLPIGLDFLGLFLSRVMTEYQNQELIRQKEKVERQAADSAMTLDLIGMVTRAKSKPEVISGIVELFTML